MIAFDQAIDSRQIKHLSVMLSGVEAWRRGRDAAHEDPGSNPAQEAPRTETRLANFAVFPYHTDMYNAKIMDHFQNPRNTGELPDANGIGSYGSPNTGDVTKIYLKIVDGRVADIRMQTFGSAVAIASSSMATELVKGKSVDEAEAITREDVSDALDGIPPDKMQCSNLAPDAIKAAIANFRKHSS